MKVMKLVRISFHFSKHNLFLFFNTLNDVLYYKSNCLLFRYSNATIINVLITSKPPCKGTLRKDLSKFIF